MRVPWSVLLFSLACTSTGQTANPRVLAGIEKFEDHYSLQPIALLESGNLRKLPYCCDADFAAKVQEFERKHLAVGSRFIYPNRGEVEVSGFTQDEADQIGTSVSVRPLGEGAVREGLVVSGNKRLRSAMDQVASTNDERNIQRLANQFFRNRKTPAERINSLKQSGLRKTDLDHNGSPEIIATYQLDQQQIGDKDFLPESLLLVCPANQPTLKTCFTRHRWTDEDAKAQMERVFDHADIDGDGRDEIVTLVTYYEWWGYDIYSHKQGKWRVIYSASTNGL